jgi:ADP-ribose pyrophosphatase YjhB (NUDIX family)
MSRHLLSGKWTQPGGHVELNESPWTAVQHEITEESGYTMPQLAVLQPKIRVTNLGKDATLQPVPVCLMTYELGTHPGHFHTDIIFAFTAQEQPAGKILEDESAEVAYFSRAELVALQESDIPDNVRQVALFVFDECLPNWEASQF